MARKTSQNWTRVKFKLLLKWWGRTQVVWHIFTSLHYRESTWMGKGSRIALLHTIKGSAAFLRSLRPDRHPTASPAHLWWGLARQGMRSSGDYYRLGTSAWVRGFCQPNCTGSTSVNINRGTWTAIATVVALVKRWLYHWGGQKGREGKEQQQGRVLSLEPRALSFPTWAVVLAADCRSLVFLRVLSEVRFGFMN